MLVGGGAVFPVATYYPANEGLGGSGLFEFQRSLQPLKLQLYGGPKLGQPKYNLPVPFC